MVSPVSQPETAALLLVSASVSPCVPALTSLSNRLLPETIGQNRPLPSQSCLWSERSITAMESKLKQVLSCLTQAAYRSHPNLPRSQKQATAGGKSDHAHQRKKDIRKDLDKCQTLASLCPCLEGMTYYFPTLMCNSRQGVPPAMPLVLCKEALLMDCLPTQVIHLQAD